jgi:hypothetical protein
MKVRCPEPSPDALGDIGAHEADARVASVRSATPEARIDAISALSGGHSGYSSVLQNPMNVTHVFNKQGVALSHLSKIVFEYGA